MNVRPEQQDSNEDSARGALGSTLRYLREKAGKSLSQLAEDTNYDKSYLYRLEAAERISKRPVMEDLDTYYGTGDLLVRLWKLARVEVFKGGYKMFMRYEATATIMHKYMLTIPGLFQTEAYARAVLSLWPGRTEEDLEEQVAARVGRQDVLHRKPPPNIRVILDESVLRCPIADQKVWAEQLAHLRFSAEQSSTTLQVLPLAAGFHSLKGYGSLSLLWQEDGGGVVYLEGNASGELLDEAENLQKYRLAYDQVRDLALSPPESVAFIERVMEDYPS
ncbi:helix-turn-helix domain-containing protein [Streptomyces sp. TE5632]